MLALLRIVTILVYFLLINFVLIVVCLARPFHRDNVYFAGILYSSIAKLLGLKLVFRVPDSVKNGGPYVFICNHQNSYDLITVCGAAQKGMVTVGKKSLKWIPIFGQAYWLSGNIMIDRKNSGRAHDTLKSTVEKIKQRRLSVWFFPEGTRSYGKALLPFKSGAFRIAQATGEEVVTVCASNLHNKVKLNRWDNGTLLVALGEPQAIDADKTSKECGEYFRRQMAEEIKALDLEVAEINKTE